MGYQPYMRDLPEADYAPRQTAIPDSRVSNGLKRATDLVLAVPVFIALLPAMLIIALIVRIADGGPVLFRHTRIGKNGKHFRCIKFRSMGVDAEAQLPRILKECPVANAQWRDNQKIENDPRVTGFGKFLRKSSLDELPQLLNVIRGDMSIVGPRPIVREEIEKYGEDFAYYAQARPGLTGLWQVSGRSDTSYEHRVQMDVKYVSEWSYGKDLMIMLKTIPAVLRSNGAI